MQRTLLVSLAAVVGVGVLLVVFLRLQRSGDPTTSHGPANAPRTAPADASSVDTVRGTAAAEPGAPGARTEAEGDPVVAGPAPAAASVTVLGRVTDESDAPIVGARVRLAAWRVWAEGVPVPRLEPGSELRGFEVETDADGGFRVTAPVPTAQRTSLRIAPDPYHDSHTVWFDSQRPGARPPLREGERDLGVLRLARTGVVRGRVTDVDGRPVPDAKMGVGPEPSITYGRDSRTEEDGTYRIAHAPVGTYGVSVVAEGYLAQFQSPVSVAAGQDTTAVDFVLEPAPSIEGLCLDGAGRPLEGVRLSGWPASAGRSAQTRSGADGRFALYLHQEEPHTLGAKLDGYRGWGNEHDESVVYAPGTRNLEVRLAATARTRFTVVDAETRAPIERFGLAILEDNGSRSQSRIHTERRPPRTEAHPDGVAEATSRPGLDLFVVFADGYLLAVGDVEHTPDGTAQQTIALRRGATLRGRVLRDGAPTAGARVEVERGRVRGEGDGLFRALSNTSRTDETDASGRFAVTGLEAGTQRLTVHPAAGAPLVLAPLELSDREDRDLGDLVVQPGASIAGRVLVPPDVEPGGLRVYFGDWREGVTAVTDAEGAFRFEDLAAGTHVLTLGERPGELAGGATATATLTSGAEASATIDARDWGTCRVTLTIELDGLSAEGLQVDLVSTSDEYERERLGNCDEAGRVSDSVRGWGEARVVVWLPGSRAVEHPTERIPLRARQDVEHTVWFEFARLRVRLPDGVLPPRDGYVQLRLAPLDADAPAQFFRMRFSDGEREGAADAGARVTPDGLAFDCLTPGVRELVLELVDADAELVEAPLADGRVSFQQQPFYRATRAVTLVAGEEQALVLD